jgi:hypothetical protein
MCIYLIYYNFHIVGGGYVKSSQTPPIVAGGGQPHPKDSYIEKVCGCTINLCQNSNCNNYCHHVRRKKFRNFGCELNLRFCTTCRR